MGTWGPAAFDNDAASDWLADLDGAADAGPVEEALRDVTRTDDYLDADEAQPAVAAAELVAAMGGRPAPDLPAGARAWAAERGHPDAALVELARAAVARVRHDSELKELWEDADPSAWEAAMDDLAARLAP